jgi:hypothetical protein
METAWVTPRDVTKTASSWIATEQELLVAFQNESALTYWRFQTRPITCLPDNADRDADSEPRTHTDLVPEAIALHHQIAMLK